MNNFTKCLLMLGHDLEMFCTKFNANRFRIDGEIDEKHALQIYQNNCVLECSSQVGSKMAD